jgi:hypothetical protein
MTSYKVGQKVMCNGYEGAITEVHTGQLEGMVTVRMARGSVTVDASPTAHSVQPRERICQCGVIESMHTHNEGHSFTPHS